MGDIRAHPEKELPDWASLKVLHRNTLEPRSSFYLYDSEADALSRDVSKARALSLSGKWKFHLAKSPFEAPSGFEAASFDASKWSDIEVPGTWQMQGFGKGPHYTNVQFPFFVDPPHPPYDNNECGSYVTTFRVPERLKQDQLRLRFEGVDSGFHVWINGKEVGYSQGARNPSEWDVTDFVNVEGENILAVRVYQFTDGSYIEDQDQWWLSGIFRDVFLLGFPKQAHLRDFSVRTTFVDSTYTDATLKVDAQIHGAAKLSFKLLDADGHAVQAADVDVDATEGASKAISVKAPHKWTAETPYLYTLILSLDGKQFLAQRLGFRQVELKDGLIKVNGQRVVFKGANRHEHHPLSGRTVPFEFLKHDLVLMKTHNLNAIRTCHQPSDPRLYELADELGLWVMDEADLECHGFETIADAALDPEQQSLPFFERQKLTRDSAAKWTSDNPEWRDAYLDRAEQMWHRDKNHTSVIMWSLGNESFFGRNHVAMRDWLKDHDNTRLIHYEPDLKAEHMDMYSRMYPDISEIVQFGEDATKKKPLVLCEYIHAMGTGPGNIKEYVDAFYKYPKLQGGWVWEWANHGLLTKTKDGKSYYGYGGDFGDIPNDYNFVMDGVLNSDHSPRSALLEYKKAVEPVQYVSHDWDSVTIINRLDFQTLDHLECVWSLTQEQRSLADSGSVEIPANVGPGQTVKLDLPKVKMLASVVANHETWFNLSFREKQSTTWCNAGHEVAMLQVLRSGPIPVTLPKPETSQQIISELDNTNLTLTTSTSVWQMDLVAGSLSSWTSKGKGVVSRPLLPSFYRAPTDNDTGGSDGKDWKAKFISLATVNTRSYEIHENDDGSVSVTFQQKYAPPVLSWSLDLTTEYVFSSDGTVRLNVKGKPTGQNLPKTLPRIGVTLGLPKEFCNVQWFGRGPGESYKDMKLSQKIDQHSVSKVDELWTGPDFPQECSNRTDTRWLELSSGETFLRAEFTTSRDGIERHLFDFMASHYEVQDIDAAQHPYELEEKKQEDVILRLDADHHGLGTGSCGPKTLDEYALRTEPFEFTILLKA